MDTLKCPMCGNTKFLDGGLSFPDLKCYGDGGARYESKSDGSSEFSGMTCNNCGYVLVFNKKYVERYNRRTNLTNQIDMFFDEVIEKINQEIAFNDLSRLESEKTKLEKIANDENQALKTVNEAKEKISKIDYEIKVLPNKIQRLIASACCYNSIRNNLKSHIDDAIFGSYISPIIDAYQSAYTYGLQESIKKANHLLVENNLSMWNFQEALKVLTE